MISKIITKMLYVYYFNDVHKKLLIQQKKISFIICFVQLTIFFQFSYRTRFESYFQLFYYWLKIACTFRTQKLYNKISKWSALDTCSLNNIITVMKNVQYISWKKKVPLLPRMKTPTYILYTVITFSSRQLSTNKKSSRFPREVLSAVLRSQYQGTVYF